MPFDGIETRSEPRRPFYSPIEFVTIEDRDETLKGFAVNISDSGLCIHTVVPLRESQEITIMTDLPTVRRKFVVRWCTRLLKDFFAVGLKATG